MGNSLTRAIRVARRPPAQAVNEDILRNEASRVAVLQETAELVNSRQDEPLNFQGSEQSLEKLLRGIESRPAFPSTPKNIKQTSKEQYELRQRGRITTVTLRSLLEDPRSRCGKADSSAELRAVAQEYGVDEHSFSKLLSCCHLPTIEKAPDGRLVALSKPGEDQ